MNQNVGSGAGIVADGRSEWLLIGLLLGWKVAATFQVAEWQAVVSGGKILSHFDVALMWHQFCHLCSVVPVGTEWLDSREA